MNDQVELTFFEDDVSFRGDLKLSGDLMLNGKITGSVIGENSKIIINKNAEIKGQIEAKIVENYGKIYGEVKADEYMVYSEAENDASVVVKKIVVEYGAFFSGNCTMVK